MPKYGGNYRQYRDRRGTAHHGGKITSGIFPRSTLIIFLCIDVCQAIVLQAEVTELDKGDNE